MLHIAARAGNEAIVRELLQSSVDKMIKVINRCTNGSGRMPCFSCLFLFGMHVHEEYCLLLTLSGKGPQGVAMEVAVQAGHRDVAWLLHGTSSLSPLIHVCGYNHIPCILPVLPAFCINCSHSLMSRCYVRPKD